MGEKGNDSGQLATATMTAAIEPSIIERVTTTTTATIVDTGTNTLAKVRDRAVDHSADAIFEKARGLVKGQEPEPEPTPAGEDATEAGDDEQSRG